MAPPRRPDPEPLELDGVRVTAAGTVLWLVALVVLVVLDLAGRSIPGWWPLMCLAGIALGLLGIRTTRRRAAPTPPPTPPPTPSPTPSPTPPRTAPDRP